MNPYSLEHFEQTLPVEKLRPPYRKPAAQSARLAVCRVEQGAWDGAPPVPAPGMFTLLEPRFAPDTDAHAAGLFLQRLGKQTRGGAGFAGVLVDLCGAQGGAPNQKDETACGPDSAAGAQDGTANIPNDTVITLLRAWRRAFDAAPHIARVADTQLIAALRARQHPFGLLLDASNGTIPVRRQLAEQNLQTVWQANPVFLRAAGCPDDAQTLKRAAANWHVLAADFPGAVPGALLLRRITYPKALSAGGAFPVRLWLQNVGETPVYGASRLELRLFGAGLVCGIPLCLHPPLWPVGDTVYNEVAQLPGLPPGRYRLDCRVCRPDGTTVPFYGTDTGADGWMPLEELTLDGRPRPELYSAWERQYPDGYYPLEDPQLPV